MKALRYFIFGVLGLALIALIAITYLVLTLDANEYKSQLIELVEANTGRAFTIESDLELHLAPPLVGFEIHGVSFDNPVGFGQEPMLTARRAEIYLNVVPLLLGNLHLHSVRLDGLQLRLRRKSNGHTNWGGLLAADPADEAPAAAPAKPDAGAPGLTLNEIQMTDSTIAFWDELRNRRMRGSELRLTLSELGSGDHVRLAMEGELMVWPDTRAENRVNAQVQVETEFALDMDAGSVDGENLNLSLGLTGPAFAFARIDPVIRAQSFDFDAEADSLQIEDASVEVEGATLRFAPLAAASLSENPEVTGHVEGSGVDIVHWLTLWKGQAPELADQTALRSLKWSSDFRAHSRGLELSQMEAVLDDTAVAGEISVMDFDQPRIALDLKLGQMDLNRYLTWEDDAEESAEAAAPREAEDPEDDWMRQQRLAAQIEIDQLLMQQLELTQTQARVSARGGVWELETLSGQVNDGTLLASGQMDVSGGIPTYSMDLKLKQIELGPVVDLFTEDGPPAIVGTTDLDMALNARGNQTTSFLSSLSGFLRMTVNNGVMQVGTIALAVESAVAALQGRSGEITSGGKLSFDVLYSSWNADDGRLTNDDLKMEAGAIGANGQGYIDLPDAFADYQLNVQVGEGLQLPVRIKGPFDNLTHSLDLSAVMQDRVDKGMEDLVEEGKKAIQKPGKAIQKLLDDLF